MSALGLLRDPNPRREYFAVCSECNSVKSFATERERHLWQQFHTHDPEYTERTAR
jgi:hypothetical protein